MAMIDARQPRQQLECETLDESACSRRLLLRALGMGAVAALLPSHAGAVPEKREVRLAVGGKSTLYYLPLTIAEQLGYFTDEGLSVEISDFPGGSKSLQALMGHSVDVVSGAFEHTIVMQTLAQKVQAFVLQGTNPGISLGIATPRAAAYSWPKDLKGMKVGVTAPGSSTQMLVNHLLNSVGLTPDDVSIVGVGTGAQAVAAMHGGQLDAISNVDPVMMLLEKQGLIRIVAETTTAQGAKQVFGGSLPAACLYAQDAVHSGQPRYGPGYGECHRAGTAVAQEGHTGRRRGGSAARISARRPYTLSGRFQARAGDLFCRRPDSGHGGQDEL